jgi:hypothetical protein
LREKLASGRKSHTASLLFLANRASRSACSLHNTVISMTSTTIVQFRSHRLISSKKASMARLPFGLGTAGGDGDCSYVGMATLSDRTTHLGWFECTHGTGMRIRSRWPRWCICGARIPGGADEGARLGASPCGRTIVGVESIQKLCVCLGSMFLLHFPFGLCGVFLLFSFRLFHGALSILRELLVVHGLLLSQEVRVSVKE